MKFSLDVTPQELVELVNSNVSLPVAFDTEGSPMGVSIESTSGEDWIDKLVEDAKDIRHFSNTKEIWMDIAEMHPLHIVNVIRQMTLGQRDSEELLNNEEFRALIMNLSDKIIENMVENTTDSSCPNAGR